MFITLFAAGGLRASQPLSIVPQPLKVEQLEGQFTLDESTVIACDDQAAKSEAEMLYKELGPATGLPLPEVLRDTECIRLTLDPKAAANVGQEGYKLAITQTAIQITAATPAGLFYGGQTLRQLLPAAIFATTKQTHVSWTIPCCRIQDQPRFSWRGFMIDSSRHFQSTDTIKQWIDLLALHKLNVFHWHLVDDHGWRFESKKYPLLTQIGAWREQAPIGRYGGFYTQQEMRDIVAYAMQRHVTIVPEIEIPGHSRAALTSYPNLGYDGTKAQVDTFFDFPMGATRFPNSPGSNVYNAGKEETYTFLQDILTEVMDIFPSTYIHVGGDEVNMGSWNSSAECQAMMKKNHLANGQQLEAYMMKRMEAFLNAHRRKLIGWDEILEGGLSPNATVMSWRGTSGGIAAAKSGHDAVMSPEKPLYFDHRQSGSPLHPPGFGGAIETLQEVYNYNPVPKELSPEQARHILGAQANLWTCATETDERLQLFGFPRLSALAEVAWCPSAAKNYDLFLKRLDEHYLRLDALGINYWREHESITIGGWQPDPKLKEWTTIDLDLTDRLISPATWQVTFNFQKGADALEIQGVELWENDHLIVADHHEGHTGWNNSGNAYTLRVDSIQPGTRLVLKATIRAMGGDKMDSTGTIHLAPSIKLGPTLHPTTGLRATTPVTQNRDHATLDWLTRHQQVLDLFKTTKPQIVMIGASIIHYWAGEPVATQARAPESWKLAFGDQTVANLGFGGDRTENVLWRIDHGELDGIAPRQAIVLIGTNNLTSGDSVSDTVAGIEMICLRIHEKLPQTKLLVLGLLPCIALREKAAEVDRVNFQLETRLHPQGWIRVLDLGNKFRNPDGSINDKLFSDGLHPNKDGYAILGENLKSFMEKK